MFIQSLKSEFLKIRYTPSFLTVFILFIIGSLVWSIGNGVIARTDFFGAVLDPTIATYGVTTFMALPFMFVFIAMSVTHEFNHRFQMYTNLSTPRRIVSIMSKWLATSIASSVAVMIAMLVSQAAFIISQIGNFQVGLTLQSVVYRPLAAIVAMFILTAVIQGMSYLTRSSAGTLVMTMIMYIGFDKILILVPKLDKINQFLLFTNINQVFAFDEFNVEYFKHIGIALIWGVVLFAVGAFVNIKRDTVNA